MKAFSMGFPNAVAISGKSLSEIQTEQLIRLDVDITLCLDNDVTEDEINSIIKKITFPFFYKNIYIIKDTSNILKEKDSPVDVCLDEFLNMYWNKQKAY
jgi:DNA primase